MILPDYVFECSWEVCNKVGGIYTVLSSKALTLKNRFADNLIFIGPDLNNEPDDFKEDSSLFSDWKISLPDNFHVKTGRWLVPGEPVTMLIAFETFFDKRDSLYYDMWDTFRVDSSHGYGDYDEACIFAYSTGMIIESFYNFYKLINKKVAAQFNEWMLGMGALYIQKHVPTIATLFTTHATTVGRSIAGNNKPLYSHLNVYDGCQMAWEMNVEAKHSLEKQTALHVDCFTTVSEITAIECRQLLGKTPAVVTPNGFERGFVPNGETFINKRNEARKLLLNTVSKLTGHPLNPDAFLMATSGRYEYRNKGLDVFIDTMNLLRHSGRLKRDAVAFIMVPTCVHAARADLKFCIDNDYQRSTPLQMPFLTHWIRNIEEDKVINFILSLGFTNTASEKLKIVFIPCYLDGQDGIFNKSYYDLLIGMDATIFASYYEPWGYTPLESIAFGIPTVTTDLAGFGLWVRSKVSGNKLQEGSVVVERTDENYSAIINLIAEHLLQLPDADTNDVQSNCLRLSKQAEWSKFINYYYRAFDLALQNAERRKNIIKNHFTAR